MNREEAREILTHNWTRVDNPNYSESELDKAFFMAIEALSAEAVSIHNDGTLEVKVPNAQKVGRVLVMDTDSHIGGGLFYPAEAVHGEWVNRSMNIRYPEWERYTCSVCGKHSYLYDFCPNCGAKMKGADDE